MFEFLAALIAVIVLNFQHEKLEKKTTVSPYSGEDEVGGREAMAAGP